MSATNLRSFPCLGGPLDGTFVTIEPGSTRYCFPVLEEPEEIGWSGPVDARAPFEHKLVTYTLRRHVRRGMCLVWEGLHL